MSTTTERTHRPLLEILVEHVGLPLPEGCDAWGMRAVHPDLRSSRGYRWPWPGHLAEAPGPILEHRGSCPSDVGDGICTATSPRGMRSGGIRAHSVLLTAHAAGWIVGDSEPGKLRLTRAQVVELVDLPGIARQGLLQGADLRDADLQYADLRDADLRGANLQYANLQGADLRYANLQGADLRNANLRNADLRNADLRYADLQGANLRYADLRYADLRNADLQYADLQGANLQGANLQYADLQYANLRNADLDTWERGPDGYARRRTTPATGKTAEADEEPA